MGRGKEKNKYFVFSEKRQWEMQHPEAKPPARFARQLAKMKAKENGEVILRPKEWKQIKQKN